MVAVFIDLKVAFDSVERELLLKKMERRGVRERLVRTVDEIYKETKNRVKMEGETGENLDRKRCKTGMPTEPASFQHNDSKFGGGSEKRRMGMGEVGGRKMSAICG